MTQIRIVRARPTPEELARLTTEAQGLPFKIEDEEVLRRIARILNSR